MLNVTPTPIRFILDTVRPFHRQFGWFFLVTGFAIMFFTSGPYVVSLLIDRVVVVGVDQAAWLFVGLFVVFRLFDEWLWRIGEIIIRSFLLEQQEVVRRTLLTTALSKQHDFFVNANSGQISYWINNSAGVVTDVIENIIWYLWPQLFSFFFVMFFLTITNWVLAIVYGLWIIGLIIVLTYRSRRQSRMIEESSDARSFVAGRVSDAVANNMAVRTFAAGASEVNSLKPSQNKAVKLWMGSWRYGTVTNAIKGNSAALVSGLALSVAVLLYAQGSVGLGSIALLVTYITSASEAIWALSVQVDNHIRNYGTLKNALTNLYSPTSERTDGSEFVADSITLTTKDLQFAYPDQPKTPVLRDFNLQIKPGERVGIVGHSGAGKSTLTGLLLGLHAPTGGTLLLNDIDINSLSLASIRSHVAFVPQDSLLFNRTIAENIAYGSAKKASRAAIIAAARKAHAHDFIEKLSQGYDTLVGERGVKLSGGQRQRIAIARAMLSEAPLVILDEATSALDSVSEQHIQKAFTEVMKGRTAVVIAHRLSTLKHLDRIVVIDTGTIAESGTHEELLASGGIYADLWRRQKDGFLGE